MAIKTFWIMSIFFEITTDFFIVFTIPEYNRAYHSDRCSSKMHQEGLKEGLNMQ